MKKLMNLVFATAFSAVFSVFAETVAVGGGEVTYSGATASRVGDDLVLTFTDTAKAGSFTLDGKNAMARMLVVGGGGAGGSISAKADLISALLKGAAGGGGAGGFSDHKIVLEAGNYTVTVGKGGAPAQTVVSSWVGGEGTKSEVLRDGELVYSVPGGGGGGASKVNGNGMAGGSGGGGSWYGTALSGGTGVEGFGFAGGTPTEADIGGGGGGAGGRGKADGTAGAAQTSDITGTAVSYAAGGRGGRIGDTSYVAASGAMPGAGGDGAAAAAGGGGANGIVVVRISRLFNYHYVSEPEYVKSACFTNNTNYIAFDLTQQSALLQEGVAAISGETNVTTSIIDNGDGTSTTNGYGRHSFTITLKDDYLWQIGTNTSASAYSGSWRLVDESTVGLADMEIQKNVTWTEFDEAKIDIKVHLIPETRKKTPNVLFLSGLCNAHGYSVDVAKAAIDAVTEVGNIDYYFFNNTPTKSNCAPRYSGHLDKGQKFNRNSITMQSNNHAPLYGFYDTLWTLIQQGKTYDYVIFSFDRTKVATTFAGTHAHEAEISAVLKPLYESNSVLWLVDHDPEQFTYTSYRQTRLFIEQTPWFPSMLVYIDYGAESANSGWTSLAGYIATYNTGAGSSDAHASLNALMGLFCPAKYPVSNANYQPPQLNNNRITTYTDTVKNQIMASAGDPLDNQHQTLYDNADEVANIIAVSVVPKSVTAKVNDRVCVNMGLDVRDAVGSWTTNETTMGWQTLRKPKELEVTDAGVNICLSNLWDEAWIKFEIDVKDTGTFLNNQNATYNERTGKWEKDPNDGPVKVTMTPDGETEIVAEAEAKTGVNWTFDAYEITASVRSGAETGTTAINGYYLNSLIVSEGYSPEVVFNGNPGYVLTYLEIDGEEITDYVPGISSWTFPKIHANHSVVVAYEKVAMKLLRAKQRYPWNNLVDIDYFIGGAELGRTGAMYGRLVFYVEYEDPDDPTKRIKKQLRTFRDNSKMLRNGPSADAENMPWPEGGYPIDINTPSAAYLRTPGYHRVTWDSNADGVAIFQKKKVNFTMYAVQGADK